MTENINRRQLLTVGTAFAATAGVLLDPGDARSQTEPSTLGFRQLYTSRAVYREPHVVPFGLDMTWMDQEGLQTLIDNSQEVTDHETISAINLVSALLQVSRQADNLDLVEVARNTEAFDADILEKAGNILMHFPDRQPYQHNLGRRLPLRTGIRSYKDEPKQAVLIESDGDQFVLSPIVASTCSFLDWIEDTFFS
ncbi:MAG: hypothetical protein OXF79_04485 [Chloroflexi bacterium]|nr:hypothetical protein [Chloroflexota bacterium]